LISSSVTLLCARASIRCTVAISNSVRSSVISRSRSCTSAASNVAGAGWLPGPAHTALARPAWWRHHDADWKHTWLQIGAQARSHSSEALTTITKAALTGALQHVTLVT
jgi:hypothetical protein